ncbi:quinone-dependent dihydroorotate dehydrogenase [Pantoea sp. Aalb]|uniref:quinone-dependent dihydroorotate dehydrogenase n=1 Tax=Pantoea sp. Aalb TaxID=2576762 RepID=UPI0013254047|nr:quinone-dependent dihydroorotate dehydrogenase [Pantoea sp. Aalb]MXP67484.1 quinone-dependent dihydroorotate dehydrogenase [Pantoea sp. Aalb]
MLYPFFRSILFKLDPEYANKIIVKALRFISGTFLERLTYQTLPLRPVSCMGLNFPNALGLAAGLDKNAEYINVFNAMGFGFIEVGTVTPLPQSGNSKPRIFRLLEVEGIINRMGFNNYGVDYLVENLKKTSFKGILGVNIGKNTNTPIEDSKKDYLICMEKVYSYADYIAINISSPNTPKLRTIQYNEALDNLLSAVKSKQKELQQIYFKYVPVVVKIAPDFSIKELTKVASSLIYHNIDGVIATNTTLDRTLVTSIKYAEEKGGLSGRPLQLRSTEIIRCLSHALRGKLPIIGVGGIDSIISVREKIAAGATLVQIYSGLIYKGPKLVKDIITNL